MKREISIRLLSKIHSIAKIALFGIFPAKFFSHVLIHALKSFRKICSKIANFINQSEFRKKSIIGLLIETGTERGLVALTRDGAVVEALELPFGFQNSKTLLPAIDAMLKKQGIHPSALHFIAVGAGPGSYTGLRVGVAAAKGLSFACNIPLIAISTLDSFLPEEGVVLIDAKIGGAYFLRRGGAPAVVPLEELHLPKGTHVVTPQANPLRKKWEKLYPEQVLVWEEKGPNPHRMALLAFQKWQDKAYSMDGAVEILYLRKTQAEIEKERER